MYVRLPLFLSACATLEHDKLPTCQGLRTENLPREIGSGRIQGQMQRKSLSRKWLKGVVEDRSIGSFVYGAEINGSEGYLLGSRFVFEHVVVWKLKWRERRKESAACSWNSDIWSQKLLVYLDISPLTNSVPGVAGTCVCAYVRMCLCSHMRTSVRAYVRTCVRAYVRMCVRAYVRTCVCAYALKVNGFASQGFS